MQMLMKFLLKDTPEVDSPLYGCEEKLKGRSVVAQKCQEFRPLLFLPDNLSMSPET